MAVVENFIWRWPLNGSLPFGLNLAFCGGRFPATIYKPAGIASRRARHHNGACGPTAPPALRGLRAGTLLLLNRIGVLFYIAVLAPAGTIRLRFDRLDQAGIIGPFQYRGEKRGGGGSYAKA